MELTLTKAQRNVAHAASTEDSRPILCTVLIGDGKITAADGYILAEAEIAKVPESNGQTFLIPAVDILKSKDCKSLGGVILTEQDGKVMLMGAGILVTTPLDGSFPHTAQLYDGLDTPVFEISLGVNILQKMLKVCGKDSRIDLTFYGADRPVKYTNNEAYGLIMPMRK